MGVERTCSLSRCLPFEVFVSFSQELFRRFRISRVPSYRDDESACRSAIRPRGGGLHSKENESCRKGNVGKEEPSDPAEG